MEVYRQRYGLDIVSESDHLLWTAITLSQAAHLQRIAENPDGEVHRFTRINKESSQLEAECSGEHVYFHFFDGCVSDKVAVCRRQLHAAIQRLI
ncbi:MAG TPA: hypothetical protein V6C86_02150 [Oculatellaceae cyanobacterium]